MPKFFPAISRKLKTIAGSEDAARLSKLAVKAGYPRLASWLGLTPV
jgi:hypothetical protein